MEEQETTEEGKGVPTKKTSHEAFFGTMLLISGILLLLLLLGGIGFGGYYGWQEKKEQGALPSIGGLSTLESASPQQKEKDEKEKSPTADSGQPVSVTGMTEEQIGVKAKGTDVRVLNGGAAKGSAGSVVTLLEKEGYTKVALGNTTGNYTGVVVYFGTGLEKEAEVVKKSLLKTYPKAETKAALLDNKETTVGAITVILGK